MLREEFVQRAMIELAAADLVASAEAEPATLFNPFGAAVALANSYERAVATHVGSCQHEAHGTWCEKCGANVQWEGGKQVWVPQPWRPSR